MSKPITEFQKYVELPAELKIAIWESAIEPRVIYIRNRSASSYTYEVQNKNPSSWFPACRISSEVARQAYRKMFALRAPDDSQLDVRTSQLVNPDIDIVVLEPCCTGCRGFHCARNQFTESDRSCVRFMAVQVDSPWLAPSAHPCWETLSASWENIETLYLMRDAIRNSSKEDKAVIRVQEDERERNLRKRFDEWKRGDGRARRLTSLEFVVVVNKAAGPTPLDDRYKDVQNRRTGLPDDIILG